MTRSLSPRSDAGVRGSSVGGTSGVDSSPAKIASKSSAAWIPESIMNVKRGIFKANFPSWPALIETCYHIRGYERNPQLLARFSDPNPKSSTFNRSIRQCLNCLSDDGHNMRSCPKQFLNKSGLINNKIGELPESEREVVWRMIQDKLLGRSQYNAKGVPGHFQKSKRNSERSEVSVTTDQTRNFVKSPGSSTFSSN